ncbi:MAG TPA: FAD-dependent oxidoreductase, partial [Phycisphaerae bacterium]|nr:FAD-dependent oxidoreductase [Phycisphaerae bacterium]
MPERPRKEGGGLKPAFAESYDVVVAGGGVAGVAAALSAARQGARTALVEKTILLGGLATSGLIN